MTRLDDLKQRINKCKTIREIRELLLDDFRCKHCKYNNTYSCEYENCYEGHDKYYAEELSK